MIVLIMIGLFLFLLYIYQGAGTVAGLMGISYQEYRVVDTVKSKRFVKI